MCLQIYKVYFFNIHPRKIEIHSVLWENSSNYEWILDPFIQPTPSSFEQEKQNYIYLTCDKFLKRKFIQETRRIF